MDKQKTRRQMPPARSSPYPFSPPLPIPPAAFTVLPTLSYRDSLRVLSAPSQEFSAILPESSPIPEPLDATPVPASCFRALPASLLTRRAWGSARRFESEGCWRITISYLGRCSVITQAYPQLDSGHGSGIIQYLLHYMCRSLSYRQEGPSPRPAGSMDQSVDDGKGSTFAQFPRSHRSL